MPRATAVRRVVRFTFDPPGFAAADIPRARLHPPPDQRWWTGLRTIWYGLSMAKTSARFAQSDWIELGLSALAREGPDAITLERLTDAARKTRGSFYHHFADHAAFLKALAETWLTRATSEIIEDAEKHRAAGGTRVALSRRAAEIDHALERALRQLGAREPVIARAVAAADERRIGYLIRLFRRERGLDATEALARARLQHCAFVGAQMVFPDADSRFRRKMHADLGRLLWDV